MNGTRTRCTRIAVISALILGVSCPASAQKPEKTEEAESSDDQKLERARTLYSQGLTQEAAGDWAGALASFEGVARIKMTAQVRFHIARCKENLGRLNEALGGYRLAEHEAESAEGVKPETLKEIRGAREKLEARMPSLLIERGEGTAAAKVELDGVALGAAKIGKKFTVDPGPHVIRVTLPDGRSFKRTVDVREGQVEKLVLDTPDDLQPATPTPPPDADEGDDPFAPATTTTEDGGDGPGAGPWIVGGLGLASLIASGVFFGLKNGAESDLDGQCIRGICPNTLEGTQQDGENYATLTGVTFGVGLVAVGVATIWLLSGTGGSEAPTAAKRTSYRVDGWVTRGGGSVGLSGRF